jgi:MORN repeat
MYCGSWKNGKRHGRGIQTKADGSMDHCGLWKRDRPCVKGEASGSNSHCSDSAGSELSRAHSAHVRCQFGGQNTSEEDIVFMEAQFVAVADESMNAAARTLKETQDLIIHTKSLTLSPPKVQTIPATPTKMDEMSSIGSDHDMTPTILRTLSERISL